MGNSREIGSMALFPGERARVPVWVKGITDPRGLGAFDFQVTFNPAHIKMLGVSGGDPPFSNTTVYNVNKESGVLLFNNYHAAIPGPTGDILVAYLEVEALVALDTASALHLSINALVNTDGDEIVYNDSQTKWRAVPKRGMSLFSIQEETKRRFNHRWQGIVLWLQELFGATVLILAALSAEALIGKALDFSLGTYAEALKPHIQRLASIAAVGLYTIIILHGFWVILAFVLAKGGQGTK